jgi:transposase
VKQVAEVMKIVYAKISPHLNEKQRRLYAAACAIELGPAGVTTMANLITMCRQTISVGIKDLQGDQLQERQRVRQKGGGRKQKADNPKLKSDLNDLVESSTRGDPMSQLLWSSKSTPKLAAELTKKGHKISHDTVGKILNKEGYSLRGNKKTIEGASNPDRDAQFQNINERAKSFLAAGQPVVSIDTKKKELIGNFKNAGREYAREAEKVNVHDFPDKELGKAVPYGVYDLSRNEGWVNLGISSDTAQFAVESIRRWWNLMGKERYPDATELLITADGGGSNGSRVRLFKVELQKLANETGLKIVVCHFPPGTSKWNKIEHKLFSFITQNWRGKPLRSLAIIVNLIAATTTKTGLTVRCEEDINIYETGIKVSNEEMKSLNFIKNEFHGEWNYTIAPIIAQGEN